MTLQGSSTSVFGSTLLRVGGLWLILGVGLALAWFGSRPPAALPVDAPSPSFSAGRAMRDVDAIATAPHPSGSDAIDGVRHAVAARLNAVGVPASLVMALGVGTAPGVPQALSAANVQNVLGVLPGRDRRAPAVLVMAHFDSVAGSPGAADDAAGVAALIEIARSLSADARAHGPATRDVVFLVTDAEEVELLGAHAFFAGDPTAAHVGVVVNMEARGDAGCAAMFQTGPHDGGLVRLYAEVVRRPCANALAGFVAGVLPNDTDFSVARAHGLGGFNFAMIDDELAYHTPLSTPAHLDPRSLQSLGDQALPLVRALSQATTMPAPAADHAYADLFGRLTPHYPAALGGWALLAGCALLAGFAARSARRLQLLVPVEVARGAGLTLLAVLAAALALRLAGRVLAGDETRVYALLVRYDLLLAGCVTLAIGIVLGVFAGASRIGLRRGAAVAALVCGLAGSFVGGFDPAALGLGVVTAALAYLTLGRPVSAWNAWLGAIALGWALTAIVQLVAAPAAVVLAWPLVCACLGAAAAFGLGVRAPRLGLCLAGASAVVAVALAGGWSASVFAALGVNSPEALACLAAPALFALAPFIRLWSGRRSALFAAPVLGVLGAVMIALVGAGAGTAMRPATTDAHYLAEPAQGRAWRVAPAARTDPWTAAVLRQSGVAPQRIALDVAPFAAGRVWATPAPLAAATSPPELFASEESGRLVLTVRAAPGTRGLDIAVHSDVALTDPRLDARPIVWPATRQGLRTLRFEAPTSEGVTVSFAAPPHGVAQVAAIATSDGWPAGMAPPKKPISLMGSRGSDTTRVMTRTAFDW